MIRDPGDRAAYFHIVGGCVEEEWVSVQEIIECLIQWTGTTHTRKRVTRALNSLRDHGVIESRSVRRGEIQYRTSPFPEVTLQDQEQPMFWNGMKTSSERRFTKHYFAVKQRECRARKKAWRDHPTLFED